jgi:ribonuclease P/MRP protein subunit RPP1
MNQKIIMPYYDLHVHSAFSGGKSSLEEIAFRAKLLGYGGVCFAEYFKNKNQIDVLKEKTRSVSKQVGINIFLGFEARNSFELKRLVSFKKKYDVLLVRGYDLGLNRKAVETPEVDILTHPELERRDSGFNHIMAKLAAENNVAIEVNFREILLSSKARRSHILQNILNNVRLCKKFKTPIIICSGAISHWQLRDPKILISMGCLLGLELNEAKKCISDLPDRIIKTNKERQSKKWIMPGVKEL